MQSTQPTAGLLTYRAEHEVRERQAQRAAQVGAAVRAERDRMGWISLRVRIGSALLALGRRLQGTAPATTGATLRVTSGSGVASPPPIPRPPAQRVSPVTNLRL
jgi:hypothetical protein